MKPMQTIAFTNTDHTPDHKRPGEVFESTADLEVTDYDGTATNPRPWTQLTVTETYRTTTAGGRGRTIRQTITYTLRDQDRAALIDMLARKIKRATE